MYILVTYDVQSSDKNGAKRLRQVARVCLNYGQRVQASVFECLVTPSQRVELEAKLRSIIKEDADSIRIYQLGKDYKQHIQSFGRPTSYDVEGELMV